MDADAYSEIEALQSLCDLHQFTWEVSPELLANRSDFPLVKFTLGNHHFTSFVDDEYKDLQLGIPPLALCVILRTLENYEDPEDYLVWCQQNGMDVSNSAVLQHYRDLGPVHREVKSLLGEIDSHVSDFDFELNAGAAQTLRKSLT